MSVIEFCRWIENTTIATTIRDSLWLFPVIESVHLLGLSVIGGAILVVDLRLLNAILRKESVAWLAREVGPWLLGSLFVMLVTGVLLFMSEATKCYESQAFWIKIGALILGIPYTILLRRRIIAQEGLHTRPVWLRLSAVVSLSLWGLVAWGGRWIGFGG